jgi:hypothetical protein
MNYEPIAPENICIDPVQEAQNNYAYHHLQHD